MLDFECEDHESTRILVDPWLSDHAVGDGMGRFPRIRFEAQELAPIHGVYLTHAHSDHLDPYTLVRLWRELAAPPTLLLPITLAFLVPIFEEHLPGVEIQLLSPHEPSPFHGVELLGFYDVTQFPTNEEDVMVLVVTNGSERVLVEADANLSLDHPELLSFVSFLMRDPKIESAVFLTTENELTGTLESKNYNSFDARAELVDLAVNEMLEAVQALYASSCEPDDLWGSDHVLRLIHGQGLTVPHELDPRWHHILFPVRIAHRVREERAVSERLGLSHGVEELTVGAVHTVLRGEVTSCVPHPSLRLLDEESKRTFDPQLAFFPEFPCSPLRSGPRDQDAQRVSIASLLNERFLPYLHGLRLPPVIHLLASYGGSYCVRVHFGTAADVSALDFVLGFGARGFVACEPSGLPHESYWANDLDDFLEGRCDEFSGFSRSAFPGMEFRLLSCLATPLLNSDLLAKRVAHHFERAVAGLTPGSFVLDLFPEQGEESGA